MPEPPRLLEDGYDIGTIEELLDHADLKTTMIYTYVLQRAEPARQSCKEILHDARATG